jgi:outer membrane lipoprotein-sorting protein
MRNDMSNIMTNAPVDEKTFEWTPPADFKVTEPFAK